jgi:hypothetical protein
MHRSFLQAPGCRFFRFYLGRSNPATAEDVVRIFPHVAADPRRSARIGWPYAANCSSAT